jgi:hypothetical protein
MHGSETYGVVVTMDDECITEYRPVHDVTNFTVSIEIVHQHSQTHKMLHDVENDLISMHFSCHHIFVESTETNYRLYSSNYAILCVYIVQLF